MKHMIREAIEEDSARIAQLISVLGYELDVTNVLGRLREYSADSSKVFVALDGEVVIGFLSFHAIPLFHESAKLGRITAMAIDPQHHRQGIGRSLVSAAKAFALECGCSRIEVVSGDHREHDAHLFYKAQGYESDCRRFQHHLVRTRNN